MDELILRQLNGEVTDVEQHRLEKWRAASPGNEGRYQEVRALWEGLGTLSRSGRASTPDAPSMMAEAERRRARSRARRSRREVLRSPWIGYGVAAAAGLALAFIGLRAWTSRGDTAVALAAVESSVGPGGIVAMTLSDGSFLRVAEGARMDFPAKAGRREVVLDGRAFFAVARARAPFVVRTAAGELRVTGTRFEVRTEGDDVRVIVVEGTVELVGPAGAADLEAGQVGTVQAGGAPRVTTVGDVWALLDWPGRLLAFQRTSLRAVAGQLAHEFGVEVRIADSLVADRRVTGSFQDDSLDEVVDALCAVTGIRCERVGSTVVLGVPPG